MISTFRKNEGTFAIPMKTAEWKPIAFRLRGRPKRRWEDDVNMI
jgi:hypothetical protein